MGAGLPAPHAARRSAEAGLAGLHIFVGVPGTAGGGVYMNAGCHGGDWAETVERVTVVDASGQDAVLARADIPFGYRRSGLGRTSCSRRSSDSGRESGHAPRELAEMFDGGRKERRSTSRAAAACSRTPSAPSWKRGDGPRTAGQLIEAAGLKGQRIGGAEVSPMHANYFVNTGGATAADVRGLIRLAQPRVEAQFGVRWSPR